MFERNISLDDGRIPDTKVFQRVVNMTYVRFHLLTKEIDFITKAELYQAGNESLIIIFHSTVLVANN